jgi:hypothetical protein
MVVVRVVVAGDVDGVVGEDGDSEHLIWRDFLVAGR